MDISSIAQFSDYPQTRDADLSIDVQGFVKQFEDEVKEISNLNFIENVIKEIIGWIKGWLVSIINKVLECIDKAIPEIKAIALEVREKRMQCVEAQKAEVEKIVADAKKLKQDAKDWVKTFWERLKSCGHEKDPFKCWGSLIAENNRKIKEFFEGKISITKRMFNVWKDIMSCKRGVYSEAMTKAKVVFKGILDCVKTREESTFVYNSLYWRQ